MSTIRINFNKEVKMHKACSKDEFGPAMNNIYFKGNYAYATDGYIIVKNYIEECSTLDNEQIQLLDEKMLSAKNYEAILKYDTIIISEDGIQATKGDNVAFFYFSKCDSKFPNVEKMLQDSLNKQTISIPEIGINVGFLAKLNYALHGSNLCRLTFKGESNAIIFSSTHTSSVGLIMIVMLNN